MLRGRAGSNGGGCPRPGPLSRGLEHKDPRRLRGARPSDPPDRFAGTAQRHRLRPRPDRRHPSRSDNRRQGIRRRSSRRQDRRWWFRSRHSAKAKPQTSQRFYDTDLYKERNRIERFFNRLKQFRRVATRYDKLLANFMGFVKLAAIAIWLR